MRVFVSGPHCGPLHTVLGSSRPRRHRQALAGGWLVFYFAAVLGVTCAWLWATWAGIAALVFVLACAALVIYGIVAAHREMARREAARR